MGTMFRLMKGTVHLAPNQKVVKADEYEDIVKAQDILTTATRQAEQIIADAHEEYEREKERGYEDGLSEGKLQMAEMMMDNVASSVDYLEKMELAVVDIVMQSLRKILGTMDDQERVTAVVRKALSYVKAQKKVILKVSTEEFDIVKQAIDDLQREFVSIGFLDVAADSRLKKGDCLMESDIGVVNASLDIQLKSIRSAFLKRLSKEDSR